MIEATTTRFVILRGLAAVADDTGRLLAFQTMPLAALFAAHLGAQVKEPVAALVCTPEQIAELLVYAGYDGADHLIDFEAQTTSAEDAERWAVELAERCARQR